MRQKIIAASIMLVLLAVCLTPLTTEIDASSSEAVTTSYGAFGGYDEQEVEDAAIQILSGLPENYTTDDLITASESAIQEYGVGLGVVALAFVVGLAIGYMIGSSSIFDNDVSTVNQIEGYEQEMLASKMESSLNVVSRMVEALLPNDSNMIRFTSTYWERAVEFVISDPDVWGKNRTIDVESILEQAGVRETLATYAKQWERAISEELWVVSKEQKTIASDTAYQNMSVSFEWDGGSITQSNPSSTVWAYPDLKSAVLTENSNSTVYLDNRQTNAEKGHTFYIWTSNGSNAALQNVKTGAITYLAPGDSKKTESELPSGEYVLLTSGAIYAGDFIRSSGNNPADVKGCLILSNGSSDIRFAVCDDDGGVSIYRNGYTAHPSTTKIDYTIGYKAKSGTMQSRNVDMIEILRGYAGLQQSLTYIIDSCVKDANVTWQIFDACEDSSSAVHPSQIMSVLTDSSMSQDEILVNYYTAMKELSLYYQDNKDKMGEIKIKQDEAACDFYVLGNIYINGELITSGAIFTPTVFVKDETFIVGEMHSVSQQMYCTIWAPNQTTLTGFNGYVGSLSGIQVATLDSGASIEITDMKYKGTFVNEHTLSVPKIVYNPNEYADPTDNPDAIKTTDATNLILVIIILIGIIAFLIGLNFGQPIIGGIAGVAIIIVGWIFADVITAIIIGNFQPPVWWPF